MTVPASGRAAMVLTGLGCIVAGWLAFTLPYEAAFAAGETTATNVMDGGIQFTTLLVLPLIGLAAGAVAPRGWFLWGPCAIAFLPSWSMVEVLIDPTSHNLWPFELVLYAAFAMWTGAGAGVGAFARSRFAPRPLAP